MARNVRLTLGDVRPDVAVEVQVGIPAGSGLSADDALRALNASLLAGTGPDLLVLDDELNIKLVMVRGQIKVNNL